MRGFSDEERDRIRAELVETGRELFLRYGPEKTNVSDITEPVGIAKSTFYRFFDSKAELYLEIFLAERDEFLDRVRTDLDGIDDPETGIVRLFDIYLGWIDESAVLQGMLGRDDYDVILRDVPEETLQRHQAEALAELVPYVESWQASGEMRDIDPDVFFGMMGSVALTTIHRDEFEDYDEGMYETTRDALVETIARGLTTETATE